MKTRDFANLKIGDIIEVIGQGKNRGNKGVVCEIHKERVIGDPRWKASVCVMPIDCTFIFARHMHTRRFKDGSVMLYKNEISIPGTKTRNVGKVDKMTEKKFYALLMFGEGGISWSTDSFTPNELNVIERFLDEFNEHVGGRMIDSICVLDDEE